MRFKRAALVSRRAALRRAAAALSRRGMPDSGALSCCAPSARAPPRRLARAIRPEGSMLWLPRVLVGGRIVFIAS
jgi:hypothetical protein